METWVTVGSGGSAFWVITGILFLGWSWWLPMAFRKAKEPQRETRGQLYTGELARLRATQAKQNREPIELTTTFHELH
jgi:hypothetical protein